MQNLSESSVNANANIATRAINGRLAGQAASAILRAARLCADARRHGIDPDALLRGLGTVKGFKDTSSAAESRAEQLTALIGE